MNNPDTNRKEDMILALSRQETARALGVSTITVDRLAKRGLLHPSRAIRRPVYPVWEVERFLRESTQAPAPKGGPL